MKQAFITKENCFVRSNLLKDKKSKNNFDRFKPNLGKKNTSFLKVRKEAKIDQTSISQLQKANISDDKENDKKLEVSLAVQQSMESNEIQDLKKEDLKTKNDENMGSVSTIQQNQFFSFVDCQESEKSTSQLQVIDKKVGKIKKNIVQQHKEYQQVQALYRKIINNDEPILHKDNLKSDVLNEEQKYLLGPMIARIKYWNQQYSEHDFIKKTIEFRRKFNILGKEKSEQIRNKKQGSVEKHKESMRDDTQLSFHEGKKCSYQLDRVLKRVNRKLLAYIEKNNLDYQ